MFSTAEVAYLKLICPMLAAAYARVDAAIFEAEQKDASNAILTGAGKHFILVDQNAEIIVTDEDMTARISMLAGERPGPGGLPPKVSTIVSGLIKLLDSVPGKGPFSEETAGWPKQCRVFVSKSQEGTAGILSYRVVIYCDPKYTDLTPLAAAGFNENQIKIMDGVQRGLYAKEIAGKLDITEDAVRNQIKETGAKLGGVSILPHIVSRAAARARELAIEQALAGKHPFQKAPEDDQ